jgi:hypothetical protein
MLPDPDESPISSKRDSARRTEADAEPVSLRDIEMILAPGIAPPPLPPLADRRAAAAKVDAAARSLADAAAAGAGEAGEPEGARWDPQPLRKRRERPIVATAPDIAFHDFRAGAPAKKVEKKSPRDEAPPKEAPTALVRDSSEEDLATMAALCPPSSREAVEVDDDAPRADEQGPTSGLLDIRSMIATLQQEQEPARAADPTKLGEDFLNLTGGILGVAPAAPILAPPDAIDLGPRADEDEVLAVKPASSSKALIAPTLTEVSGEAPTGASLLPTSISEPPMPRAPARVTRESRAELEPASRTSAPPEEPASRGRLGWIAVAAAAGVAVWLGMARQDGAQVVAPEPPRVAERAPEVARAPAAQPAIEAAPAAAAPVAAAPIETTPVAAAPSDAKVSTAEPKHEVAAPSAPSKPSSKPSSVAAQPVGAKPAPEPAPAPVAAAPPAPAPAPAPEPAAAGPAFDRGAASAALSSAASQAASCKAPDDPSGVARVSVTFAPSGRVTSATVQGPPFAGTKTGGCIARTFRNASVSPFAGDPVTVSKSLTLR